MSGDETELVHVLLAGMADAEVRETVRAINAAPPEQPAGRRRRRNARPVVRAGRRRQRGAASA